MRIRRLSPGGCLPVCLNVAFGTLFFLLIALCRRRYSRRHVLSSSVWPPKAARQAMDPHRRSRACSPFLLVKKTTLTAYQYKTVVRKSEVCLHSAPSDIIFEQKLGPTQYRWQQLLGQHSNYGSVDRIEGNSMRHLACECARS